MVAACRGAGATIVPQGGNTGLVGGGVPDTSGTQVVLSLGRMRAVREVDPVAGTITVDAGVVLADVQAAAERAGRALPDVRSASEGSCTIGGNPRDQRRRHRGAALRHDARARPRPRGRAARRAGVGRPARPAQGQHRLRPDPALRRLRGHARRDHRRGAAALPGHRRGTPPRGSRCPSVAAAVSLLGVAQQHAGAPPTPTFEIANRQALDLVLAAPARGERPAGGAERVVRPGRARRGRTRTRLDDALEAILGEAVEAGPGHRRGVAGSPAQRSAPLGAARGHLGGAEGRGRDPQARRHPADQPARGLGRGDRPRPWPRRCRESGR